MDLHSYTRFYTSSQQGLNPAEEDTGSSGGELHSGMDCLQEETKPPGTSPSNIVFNLTVVLS